MDSQELKELLTPVLAEFKQEFLSEVNTLVDQKNQGVAASVSKQIKKIQESIATPSSNEDGEESQSKNLTLKSLEQKIADLNNQLQQKEQAALEAEKRAAISKVVGDSNTLNKNLLQKVFSIEYAPHLQKEGDTWFLAKDEQVVPLDNVLSTYLSSDEGKAFLPPSGTQGSGAKETKVPLISNGNSELTLDQKYEALQQSLLG
jgi:uncharacterized protein YheU (UPF0270 family)